MRNDDVQSAKDLLMDIQSNSSIEQLLNGAVYTVFGQRIGYVELLRKAQQCFQSVGSQESDTIQGRQCMASCFFLSRQFEDSLIYLDSIKVISSKNKIK